MKRFCLKVIKELNTKSLHVHIHGSKACKDRMDSRKHEKKMKKLLFSFSNNSWKRLSSSTTRRLPILGNFAHVQIQTAQTSWMISSIFDKAPNFRQDHLTPQKVERKTFAPSPFCDKNHGPKWACKKKTLIFGVQCRWSDMSDFFPLLRSFLLAMVTKNMSCHPYFLPNLPFLSSMMQTGLDYL